MITTTRSIPDRRTALRHIHPALTIEQQVAPFALVVAWDGLELGTVHDYLAAEQLGRDWLQHLLERMPAMRPTLCWRPAPRPDGQSSRST
jgi:hypothetical protein